MSETTDLPEKDTGGPISRQKAYSMASARFIKALRIVEESLESKNPAVRFGAARLVWETVLPQKSLVELTGENGGPVKHEIDDEKLGALINDKLKKLGITGTS